jgi:hypothetical protein
MKESQVRAWIGFPLAVAALASAGIVAAAPAQRDPSGEARAWLHLIDQGRYADSWTKAGTLFRAALTQAEWARKVGITRGPLGGLVSRQASSDQRAATLPGGPDGHYATLQFNTVFAHKHAALETVVLAEEPGGWKVDAYFIR